MYYFKIERAILMSYNYSEALVNENQQNKATTSLLSAQHNQNEATLLGMFHCHILFPSSAPKTVSLIYNQNVVREIDVEATL